MTNAKADVFHLLMDHLPLDERNVTTSRYDRSTPVQISQMIAEENMANLTVMTDGLLWNSVAHRAVQFQDLDILRYIQSVKPELLLSKDFAEELPINYLTIAVLSSPMSVASEILRFLLRHCRSIIPEKAVGRAFYRALTYAEEKEGGHPSLCLPGALFLFFHRHHPNHFDDPLISIFWRIRDGPGSKELIRAIIGFL
eukprot:gene32267-41819_t